MNSILEEYRTAQAVECGYVHRLLGELDRLADGKGSSEAYVLALELLRAAHTVTGEKRAALMTAVG